MPLTEHVAVCFCFEQKRKKQLIKGQHRSLAGVGMRFTKCLLEVAYVKCRYYHSASALHAEDTGKEDCFSVFYQKLRPPFTDCFLTPQNRSDSPRSEQRRSHQVLSSHPPVTNAQGKGTGQEQHHPLLHLSASSHLGKASVFLLTRIIEFKNSEK